jgi:dihydropyrimidinase
MVFDLVVRGGLAALPTGAVATDIGIRDGRIAAIGADLDGRENIDAAGMIVTPGGVDPHCHIEQMSGMGLMNADTFESATRSAAMGGTTSLVSFAAQAKGQRLGDAAADYAARGRRGAAVDWAFHLILADPSAPGFDSDLAGLVADGHRSLKIFTTYNIGLTDKEILRALDIARGAGALTCIHAENDAIIAAARARLLDEGRTRPLDHAASRPREAEIEAVARMCRLAEAAGAPVMIFHVSTAEAVAEIRAARARGAPVWAETCPHYLFQTEEILDRPGLEGAKWMCSPPQRSPADQEALWQALALGDLQVVSSDHAPYRFDETGKLSAGPDAPFPAIANGMPGLQTRLPLLFDAMVSRGRLGLARFVEVTATAPARLYGLPGKGAIAPGMDADLVLWDPDRAHTYAEDDLHDNAGYNPYAGTTVRGWPVRVLLRGETIVAHGKWRGRPGTGRWLRREAIGTRPADITGARA